MFIQVFDIKESEFSKPCSGNNQDLSDELNKHEKGMEENETN